MLLEPFSIPGRIELSATPSAVRRIWLIATFSIPGRIELSATIFGGSVGNRVLGFQYPRSDRVVCNNVCARSGPAIGRLSVSPVGSSCLQQKAICPVCGEETTFQYPRSDRVVCN